MGAGAGYTVTLNGLKIKKGSVKILPGLHKIYRSPNIFFEAELEKGNLSDWSAEKYYESISSSSSLFEGMTFEVKGGKVLGNIAISSLADAVDLSEVSYGLNSAERELHLIKRFYAEEIWLSMDKTVNACKEAIEKMIDDDYNFKIGVSTLYGSGWVHCDLTNPIKLGYKDDTFGRFEACIQTDQNSDVCFHHIEVEAPEVTKAINGFFAGEFGYKEAI